MRTKLYYCYSELDKRDEFQLVTEQSHFGSWIWFYIGKHLKKKICLLPYFMDWADGNKLLKSYGNTHNAEKIGKYVVNAINKKLKKLKTAKKKGGK